MNMLLFCLAQSTATLYAADCSGAVIFLPPCAQEDSTTCYWNAEQRGNGTGQSFIDIEGLYFTYEEDAQ